MKSDGDNGWKKVVLRKRKSDLGVIAAQVTHWLEGDGNYIENDFELTAFSSTIHPQSKN